MPLAPPSASPRPHRLGRLRVLALLAVVPLTLLGPILLRGELFLPWLPVGLAPLSAEHPAEAEAAVRGANHVETDRLFPVLTDQIAMREELEKHRLPTWEPLFGLGVPLFAGSIAGAAYPPNWLGFLMPPERAAAPAALLSLLLAGLGAWLFLSRLGLSPLAVLVGAVAYQLGGWATWNLMYYMKVDAALWLPWSLWAVEGVLRGYRWSGLVLAAATAASLVAGFVTVGVFCLVACGLYGATRALVRRPWLDPRFAREAPAAVPEIAPEAVAQPPPRASRGRALLQLAVFLGLGVGMSAVQLVPSLEASRQSLRSERTVTDLVGESLPVATLLGVGVPDLFGSATEDTPPGELPVAWWLTPASEAGAASTANQLEWSTYAGAICALLALVALVAAPRRAALPALGLGLVLAYAQGWWMVRWAYAIPGLNLGSPARVLAVAWLLWPWLAAVGAECVVRRRPRAVPTLVLAAFAASVGAFLLWSSFDPAGWARGVEHTLVTRYGTGHEDQLEQLRQRMPAAAARLSRSFAQLFAASLSALLAGLVAFLLGRPRGRFARGSSDVAAVLGVLLVVVFAVAPVAPWALPADQRSPSTLAAVLAAIGLAALAWTRRRRDEPGPVLALIAALAIEGMLAADGHVTGRPDLGLPVFPPSDAIGAVREAAGDGRVIRYDPTPSGIEDVADLARPNMLEPYGISDLTPYTVFTPRSLNELCGALDPRMRVRTGVASLRDLARLDDPLLDLLRVSAVISREPIEHPRLEPVFDRPGFHVYHRSGALPLARIVPRLEAVRDESAALGDLVGRRVAPSEAALVLAGDLPPGAADQRAPRHFEPGQIELVERPSRDRMDVHVWGSSGGWLVLHEQYYPGWHASVNGVDADVVRADYVYRAVRLPPGDSVVRTWYAPASIFWGLLFTVLCPIVAAFLSPRIVPTRATGAAATPAHGTERREEAAVR